MHTTSAVRPAWSRPVRMLLTAGVLLSGLASSLEAQNRQDRHDRQRAERGWIGVSFEFLADRHGRTYFEIMDVREDSPAEAAGLRRGDRVLAINEFDRPEELASLTERLRLRSGDPVVMDIERDGRRQRVRLRAAPRPGDFEVGRTVQLQMESDSMVETWVRAMDSLRIEIIAGSGRDIRVRGASDDVGVRASDARAQRTMVVGGGEPGARAPFEFFVFPGEAHDSLHQEMVELNRTVSQIEHRIEQRELELRGVLRTRAEGSLRDDMELRRLQQRLEAATERSAGLEAAMAEAARATAGLEYLEAEAATPWRRGSVEPARRDAVDFSPLTPYLLGRNRVAGAEVVDLRPELARYFEVEGGVLVVDVAPGTPAAISGIVPGDVVIRLDRVVVGSVEDLRFGVSAAGETLPLTLIRQGTSVQVLLRR